ncbi:hypothetical protein [Methylocapsa sp. S129]|uniref:hypothetical protein n=1 Tax=Methylocapsa sp. S129 TaxID=1641869 RepID=UPI00131C015E|nr:hypothetical protein [Methylocapsa sp. S129]
MPAVLIKRRPEAGQRFPFIPLARAIERARELYKIANGHEVPFATAVGAWGYAEKSSGGSQTAAALKAFGLLEDIAGSDVRKVKLTDAAMRIIRDPRDISPDRDGLIREAAMKPALHREILEKYSGMPPSDEALKAFLLIDRGLKDEAVPDLIREFAATMSFAKISESATIQDMKSETASASDYIEAVIIKAERPAVSSSASVSRSLLDESPTSVHYPKAKGGMLQEIFNLDEGPVTLSFPSDLSRESYEDLKDQLDLFLRRAERRASGGLRSKLRLLQEEADFDDGNGEQ